MNVSIIHLMASLIGVKKRVKIGLVNWLSSTQS